jgi:hypothetical protein
MSYARRVLVLGGVLVPRAWFDLVGQRRAGRRAMSTRATPATRASTAMRATDPLFPVVGRSGETPP